MHLRDAVHDRDARGIVTDRDGLDFFVIYNRPRDYPGGFMVRRWRVDPPISGTNRDVPQPMDVIGADLPTLEAARALIPWGLYNLGRMMEDDPRIVEVWI